MINKDYIIDSIDFTEEEYNDFIKNDNGYVSFDEFVDRTIQDTEDNEGTSEDAIFILNDAWNKMIDPY